MPLPAPCCAALYLVVVAASCAAPTRPYLGEPRPGTKPALFAADVVNTAEIELNGVVSPDGDEFYFSRRIGQSFTMFRCLRRGDAWSAPEPLSLYPDGERAMAVDMALSPDGDRLYWLGRCESETYPEDPGLDLWTSERVDGKWQTAELVPPPVSTEHSEYYPCVVADGSLYFSSDRPGGLGEGDVWRAQRLPDGSFAEPVNVGAPINSVYSEGDTFVAPDESYLVLSSARPGGRGSNDLYVAFREDDGSWGEPVNLGRQINSAQVDFCPMVTPDGQFLFFSRRWGASWDTTTACSVLWVDARVLHALRP